MGEQAQPLWKSRLQETLRFNNGLILLLVAGFLGVFAALLLELRRDAWDQAMISMDEHVNSVSRDVLRDVEMFDNSLRALQSAMIFSTAPQTRTTLQMLSGPLSHAGRLLIFDAMGFIEGYSDRRPDAVSYAPYDFFQKHAGGSSHSLFIGAPFIDPATNQPVVGFSRQLQNANGTFLGVAAVLVNLDYFADKFDSVGLGKASTIGLYRVDGTVLVAPGSGTAGEIGATKPEGIETFFTKYSSLFVGQDYVDGVERAVKFRRVRNFPLVISVALAISEIYRNWRKLAWALGAVFAILLLVLAAFGFRLTHELKLRRIGERRYRELSNCDGLTGIANRRRFEEALEEEWARSCRTGSPLSLLLMDLDRFKGFNDSYGHQAGDDCLRQVSTAVSAVVRGSDLLARYGGEELAVLLPNADAGTSAAIGERIRLAVAALAIPHDANRDYGRVTISIGRATFDPLHTPTEMRVDHLVAAADGALYEAKRQGRNCVMATNLFVVSSVASLTPVGISSLRLPRKQKSLDDAPEALC
ncbi:sensor domain-containing diguanylate cyclase [Consotaella aegiceratis]|uniref:sensor domain-containing diguanylate cyclase n=1 Tax=Consotaella aegiceratis TaxID=3097961 RepID=UPI002F3E86E3